MRRAIVIGLLLVLVVCAGYVYWARSGQETGGPAAEPRATAPAPEPMPADVTPVEPARPVPELKYARDVLGRGEGIVTIVAYSMAMDPAPDAAVQIWSSDARVTDEGGLVDEGSTDATGRFRALDLPFGSYFAVVTDGQFGGYAECRIARGPYPASTKHVVLRPLEPLGGRVIGRGKAPVAGAQLYPLLHDDHRLDPAFSKFLMEQSGEDGRFRFAGLPQGRWLFRVEAAGYVPLVTDRIFTNRDDVVFRMNQGGMLIGLCVEDGTGEPVAGLALSAEGPFMQPPIQTVTGDDGAFELGPAAAGDYTIRPESATWAPVEGHTGVTVADGEDRALELRVARGGVVRGRVYVQGTGEGVPGATVTANPGGKAATNDAGYYELTGLWPGPTRFRLDLPEGYSLPRASRALTPGEVNVAAEFALDDFDFPVTIDAGPVFEGRTIDAEGNPVAGAVVEAHARMGGGKALSDSDGHFVIDDFEPGDIARFDAISDTHGSKLTEPYMLSAEGTGGIEIRLDIALDCGIAGHVVDATGQPADCSISVRPTGEAVRSQDSSATTDSSGRFEVLGLAPGEYDVSLFPEYRDANQMTVAQTINPVRAATVTLAPGQIHSDLRLVFDLDASLRMAGRVVDSAGQPVAFASVGYWRIGGTMRLSVHAAPDGSFNLMNLDDGVYNVTALGPERTRSAPVIRARPGDTNLVLTLNSPAIVRGRVVDAQSGDPVPRFIAVITTGGGDRIAAAFDAMNGKSFANPQGTFSFEHSGASATIGVRAEGYRQGQTVVRQTQPGSTFDDVVVELTPETSPIRGVVQYANGQPVRGAAIRVGAHVSAPTRSSSLIDVAPDGSQRYNQGTSGAIAVYSASDGTFELESWMIPEGDTVTVMAYVPEYVPARQQVRPGTDRVVLTLEEGGHLTGTVRVDGRIPEQCAIAVHYTDGRVEEGGMGRDGAYWMNEMPPGQARVVATIDDGVQQEQWAIIESGYETQVDFAFTSESSANAPS